MRTISLNENWKFRKLPGLTLEALPEILPDGPWETVTLPHTWFSDDDPYQGLTIYEKTIPRDAREPKAFLSFDAADQQAGIYVNGHFAGGGSGLDDPGVPGKQDQRRHRTLLWGFYGVRRAVPERRSAALPGNAL